jgi:class 3 adenylate cyclase
MSVLNVGAVAIVAVQICDFGSLLEATGDAETLKGVRVVRSAVARAFEAYGRHFKSADEWILGAFNTATDAVVACGKAFEFSTLSQRDRSDPPFLIRCGVHVGSAAVCNSSGFNDVFGRSVGVAQRVAAAGTPGALQLSAEIAASDPEVCDLLLMKFATPIGARSPHSGVCLEASPAGAPSLPISINMDEHPSSDSQFAGLQWLGDKFRRL